MSKLIFKNGDMFDSECESLVCPVNCEGVMGAGVAKFFREKFDNVDYKEQCMRGAMSPGCVYVRKSQPGSKDTNKILIYLATKNDWKNDSKLEWVENGLVNLAKALYFYDIKSVALPAIGSGNGRLPWPTVEITIKAIFENDGMHKLIEVYLPHQYS